MSSVNQLNQGNQTKVSASNLTGTAGILISGACFIGSLALSFLIGTLVWGWNSFIKGDACIWLTLIIFFPALVISLVLLSSRFTYVVENGQVLLGNKLLFRLDEIVAWRVGLPDNWIATAAKFDPMQFTRQGSVFERVNDMRKLIFVFQLTDNRWFFWNLSLVSRLQGIQDAMTSATENKLAEIPPQVLKKIKLANMNTVVVQV